MIEIPSQLEGRQFDLYQLEQKLKPVGYSIGGSWEYDHGSFDYKISDDGGYQFLRLPFTAVDGQLDARNCTVELGRPFLLNHVYQEGLDDHANSGAIQGGFNQFQEPADKDGTFPEQLRDVGKTLVQQLENALSE